MKRTALLLSVTMLLGGCAQPGVWVGTNSEGPISEGSRIELNRDIEIAPQQARVFFQQGVAITKSRLDYYLPSCDIEVRSLSSEVQVVHKDVFTVTRVEAGREQVVSRDGPMFAALDLSAGYGWGGGLMWERGVSVHRYFRFGLVSEAQPDVMRLTCRGALDDYHRAWLPTSEEIRSALGEYISFL